MFHSAQVCPYMLVFVGSNRFGYCYTFTGVIPWNVPSTAKYKSQTVLVRVDNVFCKKFLLRTYILKQRRTSSRI